VSITPTLMEPDNVTEDWAITEVGSGFRWFAMLLTLGLGPLLNLGELLK